MFGLRCQKIFCIGLNKTGTSSLKQCFKDLGFKIGNQRIAEMFLVEDWAKRDFRKLSIYCKFAEVFQDVPFSLPYTYIYLHQIYPNAKFILSVRTDSEEWYQSITRFHSKLWAKVKNRPPTIEDLKQAKYIYKGRPYKMNRLIFNTPESDPYNKDLLISFYNTHFEQVQDYFNHIPNQLLTINISRKEDYLKLCHFVSKKPVYDAFPWVNKT